MRIEPVRVEPRPATGLQRWYEIASSLVLIIFCLEIGLFLMAFPWTEYWERNFFSHIVPEWHRFWDNSYVKGAVSGLGVLNVYISLLEIFNLRRSGRRSRTLP
jgi:hypothetical protein